MNSVYLRIFIILFLIGGLGLGVIVVQEFQTVRGRAVEPDITQTHVPKALTELEENPLIEKISYYSDKYGYSIDFDKSYWSEVNGMTPGKKDSKMLSFKLHDQFGRASVTLEAHDQNELLSVIATEFALGKDDLDKVVSYVTKDKKANLTPDENLVKTERIVRNGKDMYKLTFEQKMLRATNEYYAYVLLHEAKYYEITAKYVNIGTSPNLAESFIDSFVFSNSINSVKAVTDTKVTLDETKITELTNPSVVNIWNVYCTKLKLVHANRLKYLKPNYKFCSGAKGSGFMISKDGHIGTNGHVAKIHPEEALVQGVLYGGSPELDQFLIDLFRLETLLYNQEEISQDDAAYYVQYALLDPLGTNGLLKFVYTLLDSKSLVIEEGESKFFVKLGNEPFTVDKEKAKEGDYFNAIKVTKDVKEAKIVAYEYPNIYSPDAIIRKKVTTGTDVGIIKLNNNEKFSYPGLTFGDINKVREGNSLLIIGYPGLVEGEATKSALLSYKSSAKPTVSKGIISSIKTDQDGRKLIQTDASIDSGNSGGPAFDKYGNVVGIATYAVDSKSGNYNFLRSIEDLSGLMKKNKIQVSENPTYTDWYGGLTNSWNGYHRKSVKQFQNVKTAYPIHPSVDGYMSDAQDAIKNGEDKEGMWGAITDKVPVFVLIGIPLLLLLIGAGGIVFFIRKRKQNPVQNPPPSPIQPMQPPMPQPSNQNVPMTNV